MGLRGPKSQFDNVACPNKRCRQYGRSGAGNIKGNGRYRTQSGLVRKFVCHRCGGVFCERIGTAFYDLRSAEEKVLLALQLVLRGMALRAVAGALEVKLDTVRFWLAQAAAHADTVNAALLTQVHGERVELDELWTFVRKKNFRAWQRARRGRMARSGSGLRWPPKRG
jgi:transposase-like protein